MERYVLGMSLGPMVESPPSTVPGTRRPLCKSELQRDILCKMTCGIISDSFEPVLDCAILQTLPLRLPLQASELGDSVMVSL